MKQPLVRQRVASAKAARIRVCRSPNTGQTVAMRSSRQPFVRAGLMGLVPLLLPFVWILELDSCGHAPTETPITGLELVDKLHGDVWAIFLPAVLVCVVTPFVALRLVAPLGRMLVHVLGLLAALLTGYAAGFVMFFSLFTNRTARGVGWLVIALFVASVIDAALRVVWSVREWWGLRRKPG